MKEKERWTMNMSIESELLTAFRICCIKQRKKITQVLVSLIRKYVEENEKPEQLTNLGG